MAKDIDIDLELTVLKEVVAALENLSDSQVERVVRYVIDRFNLTLSPA